MPQLKAAQRQDGWSNLFTGVGRMETDKRMSTKFDRITVLQERELADMYRGEGFAQRVVDQPVDDMTRDWYYVKGDGENLVIQKMDTLKGKLEVQRLLKWSRLYGGAVMVIGADDGGKLDQPLNEGRLQTIKYLKVYDRWRITWSTSDLYTDPMSPKFNEVQWYNISPISGMPFRVHESRCIRVDGIDLPDMIKQENMGWGDSALQSVFEKIRSLASVYDGCEIIIDDFVQGALTIDNLQEMIQAGQEDLIIRRLHLIDMSRHMINTMLLDKNEKYEKHSTTASGLPDLIDRFAQAVSAVTGIPLTLLFGRSPGGLNATGESDIRGWYDKVASMQEDQLQSVLERLTYLIMKSRLDGFHGNEPDNWYICFNPLWQQSDKETAETRKAVADADNIYLSTGVLTPEEVAISRFGGDSYSMETKLADNRSEA